MSQRVPKRRSNQPVIPVVKQETWQPLLVAADAFATLAPWAWMHDSELIGLHDPATGQPLLCSILGRLRSVFGLLVFRRDTGRRWILNTILNAGDSDGPADEDSALEQDCLKLEFTPKSELSEQDRAVLEVAAFAPARSRGHVWPSFRSLVPGGYPWYLTQTEAEMLLYALPRAGAFAALCRDTPRLGADLATGEVPFLPPDFDPARRSLRVEDLDWQPQVPPPEPPPTAISLDDASVERFVKLPQAPGFHLEVDVFYAPMAVTGVERPRFPKMVAAVDRASGFVGGCRLAASSDPEAVEALADVLVTALSQLAHRPEVICVQRPKVAGMLSPLAARLGIPVCEDPELAALNAAREEIDRRFRR